MSVSSYQKSSSPIHCLGVFCLAVSAQIWKDHRDQVAPGAPTISNIYRGIACPAASPTLVAKLVAQNLLPFATVQAWLVIIFRVHDPAHPAQRIRIAQSPKKCNNIDHLTLTQVLWHHRRTTIGSS
jgi:hypothetical protein